MDPFDLRKGRLCNDGIEEEKNCCLRIVTVDNIPHLCIFALRDVNNGEELRYDYGVSNLPWRRKVCFYIVLTCFCARSVIFSISLSQCLF